MTVLYDRIGGGYSAYRRADPRLAAQIDAARGLSEARRTARDRVVILTWDPEHPGFWLDQEYFPEVLALDRPLFPPLRALERALGPLEVRPVPIPGDCRDGFLGAYWRRPAMYLDPGVRRAISTFAKLQATEIGLERLRRDLADGMWQRRHRELLAQAELDLGYRLLIARAGPRAGMEARG